MEWGVSEEWGSEPRRVLQFATFRVWGERVRQREEHHPLHAAGYSSAVAWGRRKQGVAAGRLFQITRKQQPEGPIQTKQSLLLSLYHSVSMYRPHQTSAEGKSQSPTKHHFRFTENIFLISYINPQSWMLCFLKNVQTHKEHKETCTHTKKTPNGF